MLNALIFLYRRTILAYFKGELLLLLHFDDDDDDVV